MTVARGKGWEGKSVRTVTGCELSDSVKGECRVTFGPKVTEVKVTASA